MEFRCDKVGSWHFSSDCPKWPINSLMVIFRERLPYKFEVCGKCKAHTHFDRSASVKQPETLS